MGLQALELLGHGHAVDALAGNHQEADRMHRHEAAGRQHGALHALLSAGLQPGAQVGDQVQLADRLGRLGADRQRLADLGHDHADLAGPNLHPGMLLHGIDQPQLEMPAGHQEIGLVAGLAAEGDRVVVGKFPEGEPLRDQPDLGRTDDADRGNHQDHDHGCQGRQEPMGRQKCHERHDCTSG